MNRYYPNLITFFFSVAWSVIILLVLFNNGVIDAQQKFYTVDVDKIMQANYKMIGKAAQDDLDASISMVNVSKKVSEAIRSVSDGGLVLISGAVVSDLDMDITRDVIDYLGLEFPEAEIDYLIGTKYESMQDDIVFDPKSMYEIMTGNSLPQVSPGYNSLDSLTPEEIERVIP